MAKDLQKIMTIRCKGILNLEDLTVETENDGLIDLNALLASFDGKFVNINFRGEQE